MSLLNLSTGELQADIAKAEHLLTVDRDIVLDCRNISHAFGTKKVLFEVDLQVLRGEIVALVGPSGCGKSTLLRAIVGTHTPQSGTVVVRGASGRERIVTHPGRDRGIVYQRYTLFPFLTARENVAFGLMLDQTSLLERSLRFLRWSRLRREHLRQADELLERLKLSASANLYPHELSGGMCQRVAIAQALILKPEVLLLDEPFGALDEATREELQVLLLDLYGENLAARKAGRLPPYTIIIVTHELNEAIYVSDRVAALSQYWDWRAEGHLTCPGATFVYDDVAPVFHPEDPRDVPSFTRQREAIRHAAFEGTQLQRRGERNRFWHSLAEGRGQGVLA